ncbi:4-hydroxy-tetrahydrodipicolinate reductase, partial [Akkermansiaceae bacterium]|nr:4-hydroxy-tetrahydrodipicolinate reductase [Akkermansiaceae bacterium]
MKITVTGRNGRMGQSVLAAIDAEANAEAHSTHDVGEDLAAALQGSDAAIDFTLPALTDELLEKAVSSKTALVIGTTGHSDAQKAAILEASKTIP